MSKAAGICSGIKSISLPAAAAPPKNPIAAVRCQHAVERARERDPARYFQTLGDRNAGIDGPPGVRDSTAARG
jgi:hypothetical protein